MSDIIDTYSPPFVYQTVTGQTIKFKRMLADDWAALVAEIRAELTAEEERQISAAKGNAVDFSERQVARVKVRRAIKSMTTINTVMNDSVQDVEGIRRLLKFSAVAGGLSEADWAKVSQLIPMPQQMQIADEIVFAPILEPDEANPQQPANVETNGGQNQTNPTGTESTDSSDTSSTLTPAS